MTEQLTFPPAARNTDPATSKIGQHTVDRSAGVAQIMYVLESLPNRDLGVTAMEIADYLIQLNLIHWSKAVSVSKRCSDAVATGQAERLPKRTCTITGRAAHPLRKKQQ